LLKEIDITKHAFVPKHTVLNESEKEELLKEYKIVLRQLPRISLADPVIKMINAKQGDVVKIERESQTAGHSVYYRVVVKV
jgi:DNA-directed RNA polymerase subunit H (RpoH/RPB5)